MDFQRNWDVYVTKRKEMYVTDARLHCKTK